MKIQGSFLLFICLLPMELFAQTADGLLAKISVAITEKHWDEVVPMFKQAVKQNVEEAETFYWRDVPICASRQAMALELGSHYKGCRNYEKASPYYQELVQLKPNEVDYLAAYAELEVLQGKEKEALPLYEKILTLQPNHLSANIFAGNYYFFLADREKKKIEQRFSKLPTPTRMQYAQYRNELEQVVNADYAKAKPYLERVLQLFPSSEIRKTLDKIHRVEEEIKR